MNLESPPRPPAAAAAGNLSGWRRRGGGTAPASCVWPRRSRKSRRRVVFRVLLARGTSTPVTRFWRRSPSLRKIVAPVCRLGKYPLRSPSSHELSLLPPGHQPLPTNGLRVGGFFPHSPLAEPSRNVGRSPDLLGLRKKRVFCCLFVWVFYILSQALLEWRWLHPRAKIVHCLARGIGLS